MPAMMPGSDRAIIEDAQRRPSEAENGQRHRGIGIGGRAGDTNDAEERHPTRIPIAFPSTPKKRCKARREPYMGIDEALLKLMAGIIPWKVSA